LSSNTTIGRTILESRGLNFNGYFFWISVGALLGFTLLFNIGFTLALTFLKRKFVISATGLHFWIISAKDVPEITLKLTAPGSSPAIISREKYSHRNETEDSQDNVKNEESKKVSAEPVQTKNGPVLNSSLPNYSLTIIICAVPLIIIKVGSLLQK